MNQIKTKITNMFMMRKQVLKYLPISLIFIGLCSCSTNADFNGSDELITITRELSPFERIVAQDDLEVNVVQGSSQLVEVVVNDNLQDRIITTVSNNELVISIANGSYSGETFKVNIQMPNLEKLELDDNTRANVNFTATKIEFDINDSSTLTLQGSTEVLNADVNDDGELKGFSFTAEILNATIGDDSEIEINCTKELNGSVSDASEIRYRGMPKINAQTSDGGKITNAN